jgi:hypothetical protein
LGERILKRNRRFNHEREAHIREGSTELSQYNANRIVRAGVRTLLVILAFVAVTTVLASQDFLGVSGQNFAAFKHSLKRWVGTPTPLEPNPQTISGVVEVKPAHKPKEHRVVIHRGSTIEKIAHDAYGVDATLGIDLIKEFNPKIENLDVVFPGQDLLLPPLARETLLRKQPNGSYRLVAASFRSRAGASSYARLLSDKGYRVVITSKLTSVDLSLHRVEIGELKNLEEANQAWETQPRNDWFAFANNPRDRAR